MHEYFLIKESGAYRLVVKMTQKRTRKSLTIDLYDNYFI